MTIEIENKLKVMIAESDFLLKKEILDSENFMSYKSKLEELMVKILETNPANDLKEHVEKILSRKLEESPKFLLSKWVYHLFNAHLSFNLNAPFLIKHSKSDNYKKYILWNKFLLERLLQKLD